MADLAAQVAAGMAQLTAVRAQLMPDACTVTRPADVGQTPTLDEGGNIVGAAPATVYDGRCSFVQPRLPPLRTRTDDDADGEPEQRQLRTPHSADLRAGDVVTCTAAAYSPGLVGDVFVIVREDERTYATYRAYILRGSTWPR